MRTKPSLHILGSLVVLVACGGDENQAPADASEVDASVDVAIDAPPLIANGAACSADAECVSGYCASWVCCTTPCEGSCEACTAAQTGGADGTCAPVTAGLDPKEACEDTACGTGGCDGAGACELRGVGVECRASAGGCDPAEVCSGDSYTCPADELEPQSSLSCAPYRCTGTSAVCTSSCTTHADCTTGDVCMNNTCRVARRVFVTSTTHTGALGGVAGADAICAARAATAGLRGTYKAWISSSSVNATDRLQHHDDVYYRVDGTTVVIAAYNWADIIDGLSVAIATDETGTTRGNQGTWTATAGNGIFSGPSCNDWTSSSSGVFSRTGNSSAGTNLWTEWTTTHSCAAALRLFCFEQTPTL